MVVPVHRRRGRHQGVPLGRGASSNERRHHDSSTFTCTIIPARLRNVPPISSCPTQEQDGAYCAANPCSDA